ncbi:addiction module antidote protein [Bifidobacterium pseudolongum]|uniref:addiction module antidote protein n=1 Tax=Bifidobacterium pseudolongum TaxID=1694 RepID=UPI001C3CE136|nr:addiction module antidote protein [Bifidobacterium pseudolongum]
MVEVRQFEASEFLDDEETIIAYLDAAAQSGDPVLMQTALGDVAKARGMTQIAKETGVGRESLYKSLAAGGNPSFATIMKVVHALGGRIKIEPLPA